MGFHKLILVWRSLRNYYHVNVKKDQKAIAYHEYLKNGGEALRLDYPLGKDAIVIDAGGYHGDFAADIVCKFNCRVDVFEPIEQFAEIIKNRFLLNSKVNVVQAGLGASDKDEYISIAGIGSSIFNGSIGPENSREKIRIVSAVDYIKAKGYLGIDLVKINIEGGEYDLMRSLFDHPDLINSIRYFQIQFHDFILDAQKLRAEIRSKLSETHTLMWDYPFIWESWEIKQR